MLPRLLPIRVMYLSEPIEFGFFYLVPVLVILDLIIILWLVYWYYEFVNKSENKVLNNILLAIVWQSLLAIILATSGYLLMFIHERSNNPLIGFILNCSSLILMILVVIFLIIFIVKRDDQT